MYIPMHRLPRKRPKPRAASACSGKCTVRYSPRRRLSRMVCSPLLLRLLALTCLRFRRISDGTFTCRGSG
jgi:hypothetical protein